MKRILTIFLAMTAVLSAERATTLMARLKTDERIAREEKALKADPGSAAHAVELASAYIQKMRETVDGSYLLRASKLLDGVLATDANNYEALRQRTEVELFRHEFAKVIEDSLRLQGMRPGDSWNFATLGDAYMERGEYDKAEQAYQRLADRRRDLVSYNRIAFFRFVTGDTDGAIQAMEQAVRSGSATPEHLAWCLVELGNLYFKTGRLDEARAAYAASLQRETGYHLALAGLGRVAAAKGDFDIAIQNYKQAQAVVPMPDYAASLEVLFAHAGRSGEADKQRALVDLADQLGRAQNETTNRTLALIYADQNRNLARSLDLAQAELSVRRDVYSYDALAWSLFKNGKIEEAAAAMEKALAQNTDEPAFYLHAARIAAAQDKADAARRYSERASKLNPKFDVRQAVAGTTSYSETSHIPEKAR